MASVCLQSQAWASVAVLCLAGVGMTALEKMSKVNKMGKNQESVSVFIHVEEGMADDHRSLDGGERRFFPISPISLVNIPPPPH